jgi:hypothetical protein
MLVFFAEIGGMRHCAARDLEILGQHLGQPWPLSRERAPSGRWGIAATGMA